MDTFANSEYPEENNPAPEASFDAPQEPQNEAPQEPRNEVPQEHQSEPQSGTYHAAGTGRRESPYANSPYMTGQPRPYQYQYQPQMQPPEKREKKPRRSGKSPWKTVIAAVLVVALVASGCLITASGVNRKWEQKTSQITQQLGRQIDDLQKQINSVPSGTSGALPAADGSAMTPAQLYQSNVDSVVAISCTMQTTAYGQSVEGTSSGSGFILTQDGYILTNYHVVEGSNSIKVTTYDGTSYDAQLIGYDESNDIAVLKIDATDLTPVVLGDSDTLNVGDTVVAIGNPLGELTFSLTTGVVSALDRPVTFSTGTTMNLIQTDCAINSGNSGGALFNLYGEVIGITNAKYSSSSSSSEASIDNIGFAIPLDQVRSIFESIITNGYIVKPYIGVTVSDVSAESQSYGLPQGAAVRSVTENGPAAEAGLQENDIITAANGETITSSNDLVKLVKAASAGDTLELTVYRQGQTLTLTLTVGEQKTDALPAQTADETQQPQSQNPYDGQYGGQSNGQSGDSFGSWPFGFGFGG